MKPVTVGVIGCGAISGAYLTAAKKFPILEIAALSDAHPEAAEKRAQAPESGAFNAAAGRRTRPNFAGMGSTICKRVSFFNFRVQLVRRISSRKYLPVLDRLAVVYRMPVNFYQHPNVMPRVFAGSIRTAMQFVMITAKTLPQRILITGPPGP